jgi:nucleoside diphosphate kinase
MARGLAFVLINPYTIAKSRTGGVIARYVVRTDLRLAAARMFGPSRELAEEYAAMVRASGHGREKNADLIADYVLRCYAPDAVTGRRRRVMMLLFEGENAVEQIWRVTGSATLKSGSGETVRDTYGDFVLDDENNVRYFEPAVLVGPTRDEAGQALRLWAKHSDADGGIVDSAVDVPSGEGVEKTLVLIKPDNFRFPTSRPGNIIDLLSSSGLRIVGVKKLRMSVAQAEEFYGPVKDSLRRKFFALCGGRVAEALQRELGFDVPRESLAPICDHLAPVFAESQFDSIVEFMTGYKPSACLAGDKVHLGREECLALVYEGLEAVRKIRGLLGSTDPRDARPGSVRREFGKDVMVNAAHASDSVASAQREMGIVAIEQDSLQEWVDRYYGGFLSRLKAFGRALPRMKADLVRRIRERWARDAA